MKNKLDYVKLHVSNMVVSGKIKLNKLISVKDGDKLVDKLDWMWVNEQAPILAKVIMLRKGNQKSVRNNIKQPYVSIWSTGSINILGVTSMKEAKQVYQIVLKDLRSICPKKIVKNQKEVKNGKRI